MARKIGVSTERPKNEATPLGTKNARGKAAAKPAPVASPIAPVASPVSPLGNPEPAPVPAQKGKHMSLVLARGKVGKSGKKAMFTSPALRRGISVPSAIFAGGVFPETLALEGDGFVTLGEEEQKKAEARNAKRAEKGLKPKLTPQERAIQLTARQAKLEAKLKRAQEASAKLAKRLGEM